MLYRLLKGDLVNLLIVVQDLYQQGYALAQGLAQGPMIEPMS